MRVSLEKTAALLNQGLVVAVPTETVYGLAASIKHISAVRDIFRIKGRPLDNPLIVHAASTEEVMRMAIALPDDFIALADAFWPGSLTLILPVDADAVPEAARAGLPTAGFRVPNHPDTLSLLKLTGPLVMPSANVSGKPSATSARHVEDDFGEEFPVLDGGQCRQGVESTILYWDGENWSAVRLGAIPVEAFAAVLGYVPAVQLDARKGSVTPLCPGQKYRHYAPKALLHLVKSLPVDFSGAVVGYDDKVYPEGCKVYSLGKRTDPKGIAGNLYSLLRRLDDDGVLEAWVDSDLPDEGLFRTVLERLRKASQNDRSEP